MLSQTVTMQLLSRAVSILAVALVLTMTSARAAPIESKTVDVDGLKMHYVTAGSGEPVLLLHGYAQSAHMWERAIPQLAKRFTVIAPDLPGFGDSAIPPDGLDIKTRRRVSMRSRASSESRKSVSSGTTSA